MEKNFGEKNITKILKNHLARRINWFSVAPNWGIEFYKKNRAKFPVFVVFIKPVATDFCLRALFGL
jgi:hypothetical protein